MLEVSTFIFMLYAFEYIASGHMFPLGILPPVIKQALFFTPFPYQLYFPVGVYMGKITGTELVQGLVMQAGWVVVAYSVARKIFEVHPGLANKSGNDLRRLKCPVTVSELHGEVSRRFSTSWSRSSNST